MLANSDVEFDAKRTASAAWGLRTAGGGKNDNPTVSRDDLRAITGPRQHAMEKGYHVPAAANKAAPSAGSPLIEAWVVARLSAKQQLR